VHRQPLPKENAASTLQERHMNKSEVAAQKPPETTACLPGSFADRSVNLVHRQKPHFAGSSIIRSLAFFSTASRE
jgi:hypothetical protein